MKSYPQFASKISQHQGPNQQSRWCAIQLPRRLEGTQSEELDLPPLELLCFVPVLGESVSEFWKSEANRACFWCSFRKLIAFSNRGKFLAKGSECLQCKTAWVIALGMQGVLLAKSLKINRQVAVHKDYSDIPYKENLCTCGLTQLPCPDSSS